MLHFPPWDSSRLLVCYRACFFVPETVESICVAICLRSNHKMTGLHLGTRLDDLLEDETFAVSIAMQTLCSCCAFKHYIF